MKKVTENNIMDLLLNILVMMLHDSGSDELEIDEYHHNGKTYYIQIKELK